MHRFVVGISIVLLLAAAVSALAYPAHPKLFCRGERGTIIGSNGNDRLVGTDKRDVFVARGGDDTIFAGGGNDLICGNGGNDVLFGEEGTDFAEGGWGDMDSCNAEKIRRCEV